MVPARDPSSYFCCCNRIHARPATSIIGVVEVIAVCVLLLLSTLAYTAGHLMPLQFSVLVFVLFVLFLSSVTTLYSIREANETLLLSTFVVRCIFELATFFYFILVLIALGLKGEFAREVFGQPVDAGGVYFFMHIARWQFALIIGSPITAILIQAWFIKVVWKCYVYLKDRSQFSDALNAAQGIGPLWPDGPSE